MTVLLVEELKTTLEQDFTLAGSRVYQISALRPFVCMYAAPSGTFTFSIKSGSNVLGSVSFTSADIQSDLNTSNNYAYIHKKLEFTNDIPLRAGSYTVEMSSSGYTYSASSFMGWAKNNDVFFDITGTVNNETNNPHSFELWENKRAIYA
jgi:hypothetical protein